jgi:hypothetical protein
MNIWVNALFDSRTLALSKIFESFFYDTNVRWSVSHIAKGTKTSW